MTELADLIITLLWNLDHGVATDGEVQLADFIGLNLAPHLADFPHYAEAIS